MGNPIWVGKIGRIWVDKRKDRLCVNKMADRIWVDIRGE